MEINKYPRTLHITGSSLSPDDAKTVPFNQLVGKYLVIEEKVDGSNTGISFDSSGKLLLQSRGHYLTGGARERQYNLFKAWANEISHLLYPVMSDRYILYGEWLFAQHTVSYNNLPHYWLEFDIFDKEFSTFLDTDSRKMMLDSLPIHSVPVLFTGYIESFPQLESFISDSHFILPQSPMEGIYIKVENDGQVIERYKLVRHDFTNKHTQWRYKKIIPNLLSNNI